MRDKKREIEKILPMIINSDKLDINEIASIVNLEVHEVENELEKIIAEINELPVELARINANIDTYELELKTILQSKQPILSSSKEKRKHEISELRTKIENLRSDYARVNAKSEKHLKLRNAVIDRKEKRILLAGENVFSSEMWTCQYCSTTNKIDSQQCLGCRASQ